MEPIRRTGAIAIAIGILGRRGCNGDGEGIGMTVMLRCRRRSGLDRKIWLLRYPSLACHCEDMTG